MSISPIPINFNHQLTNQCTVGTLLLADVSGDLPLL